MLFQKMLINETVVLVDSIDLFRNYVVVKNLFIAVGFVNKALFTLCSWSRHLTLTVPLNLATAV